MNQIALLSQDTIDKIAAGEVVERPASVVKELVENTIDAGATAVTAEIRDGGISLIRITDNGCGIPGEEVRSAFLRHATSKIRTVEDLLTSGTLGFRGEALSSISAVSQVEMITKTPGSLFGVRYVIEGGEEKSLEEIGAPEGTTFLVRSLFYHTPARKKFLKSPVTEAGYVSDLMGRMALSHPEISFKFISNGETRLHTSGNGRLRDVIYGIYGREIAANVVRIEPGDGAVRVSGYIGKPAVSRGNRNFETYFVNGRYVRSAVIFRAIEEAYKPFLMNHRYPFTVLSLQIDTDQVDVNVHPTKMEVRFAKGDLVYEQVLESVREGLVHRELIPEFTIGPEEKPEKTEPEKSSRYPEPFEKVRSRLIAENPGPYEAKYPQHTPPKLPEAKTGFMKPVTGTVSSLPSREEKKEEAGGEDAPASQTEDTQELPSAHSEADGGPRQMELFDDRLLSEQNMHRHRLIGQVFGTYWIVEFQDKMYLIDQHAAHEKVLYERFMKNLAEKKQTSQMITPPVIVSLSMQEEEMLKKHLNCFTEVGFEIEPFGGREYSIHAVPGNLYGLESRTLFLELLDGLTDVPERASDEAVCEKIASMSCKAAVKGGHSMQEAEANALIDELLTLENPYHCPHGRPTIIVMTRYELEKKFKRIL